MEMNKKKNEFAVLFKKLDLQKQDKENKKVRNAKKVFYDNIWFDSSLEAYVYWRLVSLGIDFEYGITKYVLIYPFEYQDEKVRQMTYKPDFVGKTFVIETKGWRTDAWSVREKLIKRRLKKDYPQLKYYIVTSMEKFEEIVDDLIKRENNLK